MQPFFNFGNVNLNIKTKNSFKIILVMNIHMKICPIPPYNLSFTQSTDWEGIMHRNFFFTQVRKIPGQRVESLS